jgi:hypothetical protein
MSVVEARDSLTVQYFDGIRETLGELRAVHVSRWRLKTFVPADYESNATAASPQPHSS